MVLKILLKLLSSDYLISPNHHTTTILNEPLDLKIFMVENFWKLDILELI